MIKKVTIPLVRLVIYIHSIKHYLALLKMMLLFLAMFINHLKGQLGLFFTIAVGKTIKQSPAARLGHQLAEDPLVYLDYVFSCSCGPSALDEPRLVQLLTWAV